MKKFVLYFLRWQLSTIVLAPCIYFIPANALVKAIVGNAIGACIFFWVDKKIFSKNKKEKNNEPNHYLNPNIPKAS